MSIIINWIFKFYQPPDPLQKREIVRFPQISERVCWEGHTGVRGTKAQTVPPYLLQYAVFSFQLPI